MLGSIPVGRCAGIQASWPTGVRHSRAPSTVEVIAHAVSGPAIRSSSPVGGAAPGPDVTVVHVRPPSWVAYRCSPHAQPTRPSGDIAIPTTGPPTYWASFPVRVTSRVRDPALSCFQIVL